jgi:hypothetical protein
MDKPIVIFSYKIDDLLEELTKRTSYMGKMRGTEQEPLMIDRLSLTHGEHFMFTEFIEDAASNVYDWLKAFGRNIKHAYHAKCVYDEAVQYKHHGAYLEIDGKEAEMGQRYMFKNIVATPLEIDNKIDVTIPTITVENMMENIELTVDYYYHIHTLLDNTLDTTESIDQSSSVYIKTGNYPIGVTNILIPFNFDENGSKHTLQSVDVEIVVRDTPVNIVPVKAETYVEYHPNLNDLSVTEYYQVVKDCTNANWKANADKLPDDPRDKVMFILEQVDNFDVNMIHVIDRNIKEAIINYILFRWYEFVLPTEYENYYLKFEDYAYKAKVGMNSTVKPIQRKYNTF